MSVAVGFTEYAHGPRLADDLAVESFPHPFDSHPSLAVRLAAVGVQPAQQELADIVVTTAAQTWFDEIGEAERIEKTLWQAYEARFRAAHEESLAYRYLPETPEERAHVERFFPPLTLQGKQEGVAVSVDCVQLRYSEWDAPAVWADVTKIEAKDEAFRGKMVTFHVQVPGNGSQKLKLPLSKLADNDKAVTAVINRYYGRAMVAKAQRNKAAS
jgi:hypothetical protein